MPVEIEEFKAKMSAIADMVSFQMKIILELKTKVFNLEQELLKIRNSLSQKKA